MKKIARMILLSTLELLANTGCVLPYFFCLVDFQQSQDRSVAISFLVLYAFRAVGIYLTALLESTAATMLVLANGCGLLGSLCLSMGTRITSELLGGALLGLAASWVWPYYLTLKSRRAGQQQLVTPWSNGVVSLVLLGLLIGVERVSILEKNFQGAFLLLAVLYLLALLGTLILLRRLPDLQQKAGIVAQDRRRFDRRELPVLLVLLIFCYLLRLTRLIRIAPERLQLLGWTALFIGIAGVMFARVRLRQHWAPWHYALINRGIVMNYVMLYAVFAGQQRLAQRTLLPIYLLYLLGMVLGAKVLAPFLRWRYFVLLVSLGLTILPWTFFLGILGCSLFLGAENQWLNQG
ncbi:hypothetical protein [Lapidilactobacillus luobeiensis]|uniref:hypothetical protein n=1 Tax=Lapidilactobacillus luobeiensis TaxID=2950371 RepID=UPI0021C3A3D3|nr:hypothetical protein [Lapidilactobacillus luobeiensis]